MVAEVFSLGAPDLSASARLVFLHLGEKGQLCANGSDMSTEPHESLRSAFWLPVFFRGGGAIVGEGARGLLV